MASSKVGRILLMLIVSTLWAIQSSTSSPLESEKLLELSERFDRLQTKVESLETENEKLQTKVKSIEAENEKLIIHFVKLQTENEELRSGFSRQYQEILLLKKQITTLQSRFTPKQDFRNDNAGLSSRRDLLGRPPSSCQEWVTTSPVTLASGIYLMKSNETKRIQAVFCEFADGSNGSTSTTVTQDIIGNVDVKTKIVHFYVQRNSSFSASGGSVVPFQLERLNEGGGMNLASGVFTAPASGIYHFDFTGLKDSNSTGLYIDLQVNSQHMGRAETEQYGKETYHSVSLTASLRLKANDIGNLFCYNDGVLSDSGAHATLFTGWLV